MTYESKTQRIAKLQVRLAREEDSTVLSRICLDAAHNLVKQSTLVNWSDWSINLIIVLSCLLVLHFLEDYLLIPFDAGVL